MSAVPDEPAVRLRPMAVEDLPEVMALERRLFPHDAWPEQFFLDELDHTQGERATRRYWVLTEPVADDPHTDERLLGYVGMMCVLPLADVQTIAVAPEAQGRGLGTRLLRLVVDTAAVWGAEQVLLEVRADNDGAQALYTREGFTHIHTRRRYYPDGADALIMQKPLTDLNAPSSASQLR
ncbi:MULTISPECIES: ribosomal protein S18-alanine N-acetyltransferase [unclassified Nesterenkonia]|uniref:ribosomal protein S18-alanine N-acetyltransferase n=1 Tax=unclassified Nesterenkonia TaxID=2629769 RepID=UPI0009F680A8|nr:MULTISPECIES: ribosomal protein S18-alanine N-acetyltransferase [unclassified Nesterenkonia]MDS2172067.1 ribosomal protein S18-alanine N-acetyltransferase [Nesterenkonia sp. CL21]OSM43660.1 ribosomal-protein-alanine N-acetyltransferase [Nesterenkonia sp. PF2B19]